VSKQPVYYDFLFMRRGSLADFNEVDEEVDDFMGKKGEVCEGEKCGGVGMGVGGIELECERLHVLLRLLTLCLEDGEFLLEGSLDV